MPFDLAQTEQSEQRKRKLTTETSETELKIFSIDKLKMTALLNITPHFLLCFSGIIEQLESINNNFIHKKCFYS